MPHRICTPDRVGRLQRQVWRAFIANDLQPLTTGELKEWCFPGSEGRLVPWRYKSIRRAAMRYAKPIGYRGVAVLWKPKGPQILDFRWSSEHRDRIDG